MKTVGFYQPHLDIQGTGVSMYDYAYFNEKVLGNKSVIFYDLNDERSHKLAIKKFRNAFEVVALKGSIDMIELQKELNQRSVEFLYIQKLGRSNDGRFAPKTKNLIHCVGTEIDPHGYRYAYVSRWLAEEIGNNKHPYIPYIVNLPNHKNKLNEELGIPSETTVFGRYGGMYGWNIGFVEKAIKISLILRKDIYFLFANTPKFISHERVKFIEPFADLDYKRKFINSCDFFLHARAEGESFGAAIAEFSTCGKPVITYKKSPEKNHILSLGNKGIYYNNFFGILKLLLTLKKDNFPGGEFFNCYTESTPENVMRKFDEEFLS